MLKILRFSLICIAFFAFTSNVNAQLLLKDFSASGPGVAIYPAGILNGEMVFFYENNYQQIELWKTNGTIAGTKQIKTWTRTGNNIDLAFEQIVYNGKVYFTIDNGVNGYEPWISDGTEDGTVMLKDIWPGGGSSKASGYYAYNGKVYFSASGGPYALNFRLFVTDGTEAGTQKIVSDDGKGPGFSIGHSNDYFQATDNGLYLIAYGSGGTYSQLWKTDGTEAGTVSVKELKTGLPPAYITNLAVLNGKLYMTASNDNNGMGLWTSDGTDAGTIRVKDVKMENITAFKNGYPLRYPVVGGKIFFPGVTDADYYQHNYELWTSDGTDAGTSLVKDIYFGNETSKMYEMTTFKDKVYFGATDGPSNYEVWASDGTESGTKMLKDIYVGGTSDPDQFTPVDTLMYFLAYDEPNKTKLYRTNGTETGTYSVPLTIQMQQTMRLYSADSILYWTDYGKLYRLGKGSEPNGIKEELANAASFSVYPNPSTGSFSVTLNGLQNESAILLITDLSGRETGEKIPVNIHAGENTMLITTALKPGLYTITLSMRSGVLSKKLFIVN